MSNEHYRDVTHLSLEALLEETIALTKDGWQIASCDVMMFGGGFTASFVRNDSTVRSLVDAVQHITNAPKMTRAETLAKARDAKAARKESTEGASLDVTQITN